MEKELNLWKKKFRKSKEWKEKRDKLIIERGGKCEWCDSTEFLAPAHQDCIIPLTIKFQNKDCKINFVVFNSKLYTNYYRIFNGYLEQVMVKALPREYFKKDINAVDGISPNKLKKDIWKSFYENKEIKELLHPIVKQMEDYFIEWYPNFDHCLLLCKKCHLAQSKGLLLCKCRKRYYFQQHGSCPNCYPKEKKEEIAKRKKEREKEEEEYRKFEEEMEKEEVEFEAESQKYFEGLKEEGRKNERR